MRAIQELNEWRDGFLFVANRWILDFLNTKPILEEGPTEFLPDTHALERWLFASGIVTSSRARLAIRSWRDSAEATDFLKELISFRERLRACVLRMENGSAPTDAFVAEVNARLLEYPVQTLLFKQHGEIVRKAFFEPHMPTDVWALLMDATANLLTETNASRIRKCESCIVHFFDTSKKGSRRWCSMNICGNKIKVAAYQHRKRVRGSLGK